jgi:hypothetical protein
MLRKTEKYYVKRINKICDSFYGSQQRKRTTWWLFFIIPIFIKDELIRGDYES